MDTQLAEVVRPQMCKCYCHRGSGGAAVDVVFPESHPVSFTALSLPGLGSTQRAQFCCHRLSQPMAELVLSSEQGQSVGQEA